MIRKNISTSGFYSSRFRFGFWLIGLIIFFLFLSLIRGILLPFVVGMLTAYFLDPAVNKLRIYGVSRTLASAIITAGFFAIVVMSGVTLLPLIVHQLSMLIDELPGYVQTLQDTYNDLLRDISLSNPEQANAIKKAASSVSGSVLGYAAKMASEVLRSGLALLNLASLIFLTPVVAFYLLRDWPKVVKQIDDMLPREEAPVIREQLIIIDRTLAGFIRGQTNVCLFFALYYAIALSLLGLKFGLGLGIMTGVFLFIPFIGIATSFSLAMLVAFFQFGLSTKLAIAATVYGIGMVMESSVITPRLVGNKVGLHALWIIFGMLTGATLFGFVGILIAVPVTSVLGVLVRFAIGRYMQSPLYKAL